MYSMLAMVPLPIIALIFLLLVLGFIFLLPKLKKSKGIDKLSDGLFKEPIKDTVDEAIQSIKNSKDTLVEKNQENVQKIKDIVDENLKIDKNK